MVNEMQSILDYFEIGDSF